MKIAGLNIDDKIIAEVADRFGEIIVEVGGAVVAGAITSEVMAKLRDRAVDGIGHAAACGLLKVRTMFTSDESDRAVLDEQASSAYDYAKLSIGQCLAVLSIAEGEARETLASAIIPKVAGRFVEGLFQ